MPDPVVITRSDVVLLLQEKAREVGMLRTQDRHGDGWSETEWDIIVQDWYKYAEYLNDLAYNMRTSTDTDANLQTRARAMPYVPDEFWAFYNLPVPT